MGRRYTQIFADEKRNQRSSAFICVRNLVSSGEEPEDDAWVLDWADWAGAYKILLRRQEQYRRAIQTLREQSQTLTSVIERTARIAKAVVYRSRPGRVPEWTIGTVSKTVVGATPPWVRIPPLPP